MNRHTHSSQSSFYLYFLLYIHGLAGLRKLVFKCFFECHHRACHFFIYWLFRPWRDDHSWATYSCLWLQKWCFKVLFHFSMFSLAFAVLLSRWGTAPRRLIFLTYFWWFFKLIVGYFNLRDIKCHLWFGWSQQQSLRKLSLGRLHCEGRTICERISK